ncbi:MAG TPA: orotate phosphoribosyltransferase [bacterium]|nr:orotate phosphoribosyltransferase [bacterium]
MHPEDVRAILDRTGAVRRGHFLLTSGLHTELFLLCAQVMQYPHELTAIAAAMAVPFRGAQVEVVVGPAVGGIILAYEVARQLNARGIFAEKSEEGRMVLRRGFTVRPGERALVVEDALTTGGSTRNVIDALRAAGADVVGITALVDRSGGAIDFGVPLHALLTMRIETWPPAECPLCRAGVPLVSPKDTAWVSERPS